MMTTMIVAVFVLGYLCITLEHPLKINKAATAVITGALSWTIYILFQEDKAHVLELLNEQLGEIAGILFFLLGAMTIVELIDAHDGFDLITSRVKTTSRKKLLWLLALITFFLSAILDNLTTTIVMVSLLKNIVTQREERLYFIGILIIAANAGGAWSPLGDVTTTMLWIGGQISAVSVVQSLFIPSIICLIVPLVILSFSASGHITIDNSSESVSSTSTPFERIAVLIIGISVLLLLPLFKTYTHLPPFMGMLLGLGIVWILTEFIHHEKDEIEKGVLSVNHALRKIDTPSILFFLGILLAVGALNACGVLRSVAEWLNVFFGDFSIIGIIIGLLSAIVDNVPIVAATQGMYTLSEFPRDHFIWHYLAYCTGTGGSILIIGSAAGVAAMGLEKIDFFWYIKKVSLLALLGYLAGAGWCLLVR
jgi:Na+/H+ antiporter NhaD/arsenite permease-like protein